MYHLKDQKSDLDYQTEFFMNIIWLV